MCTLFYPLACVQEAGNIFKWYQKHSEKLDAFRTALNLMAPPRLALLRCLDPSIASSPGADIVDVGGGVGHVLAEILHLRPEVRHPKPAPPPSEVSQQSHLTEMSSLVDKAGSSQLFMGKRSCSCVRAELTRHSAKHACRLKAQCSREAKSRKRQRGTSMTQVSHTVLRSSMGTSSQVLCYCRTHLAALTSYYP
jgi:hypothetical protein